MADTLGMVYQYVMTSVQVLFGFYFFARFLHRKRKLFSYLLFGVCSAGIISFAPGATIVKLGIFILCLAAAGVFVCRSDGRTAALYAVLTVEIMQLGYGIVKSLSSILYPHMSAFDPNAVGVAFMVGGEAAALVLTGLCYGMVQRRFSDEMHSFHYEAVEKQYMLLVFIPVLLIFIMDEYINSFIYGMVVTSVDGTETSLYTNHYQMLVMQLLGIASLFCILFAYKKLLYSFRLRTELSLLEQEEHSLNRYVEEAKTRYDRTKSFRHDIKNHITVVKALLQDGKPEHAISYIEDLSDMAEKMSFPCSTNNPVADILMANKLGIADSMGIRVSCSLLLPYPCGLRDIDLCIVLSNALDNAIHACRSMEEGTEKYIHVSGRIQGDFLMLEIENSYQGKAVFKKGIGLSNVKAVAEKYGGAMNTEVQGNAFILHVLLIIPQQTDECADSCDRKKK